MSAEDTRKIRLIMELRRNGVGDTRVLSAIERVPRELFVPKTFDDQAYDNTALPIGCGQTISQPTVVGMMTQALDPGDRLKVLEIGTGSGFQAAILGLMAGEVHSIERYRTLVDLARERLASLRIDTVRVHHGDGMEGLAEQAPFDRIIVTAAGPEIPAALVEQLAEGGKLIMPRGPSGSIQRLVLAEKQGGRLSEKVLADVRFVPLVEGVASRL